jgi:hypothetical protein
MCQTLILKLFLIKKVGKSNYAGWSRFYGEIVEHNIEGRQNARLREQQLINAYKNTHGNRPKGNLTD